MIPAIVKQNMSNVLSVIARERSECEAKRSLPDGDEAIPTSSSLRGSKATEAISLFWDCFVDINVNTGLLAMTSKDEFARNDESRIIQHFRISRFGSVIMYNPSLYMMIIQGENKNV
jgi:hypothetical protein